MLAAFVALVPASASAQHEAHGRMVTDTSAQMAHAMWMAPLGGGWHLAGMAQAFPIVTIGAPFEDGSALRETAAYLTQPVIMADVLSPGARFILRTTLNVEGVTQPNGELTFGGWGEGFIDRRHPHTLLHELMLSARFGDDADGSLSLSAGRGFAPYGTDDPMARPGLKYPTNHHLSQILERWTVNGAFLRDGWSIEAGIFAGAEPDGPYDIGNIDGFGDSWSMRVAKRWGEQAAWEASASYGSVNEAHAADSLDHDDGDAHLVEARTQLWNVALRYARTHRSRAVYALVEASQSDPEEHAGYFSVLGETQVVMGAHRPYARVEYATRPEYSREGEPGTDGFFRYDHNDEAVGATRWLIGTLGYGYELTGYPVVVRPFAEAQIHRVGAERGGITPESLYGTDTFASLSIGMRVFFGGGPMRMGAYGALDPIVQMHAAPSAADDRHEEAHHEP